MATVLSDLDIAAMPWEPLGNLEGIEHRVLWRNDTSMAGVLRVAAGHHLGAHTHRRNHHHLWVLEGAARIMGEDLGPGSYVHIPSGTEHDIEAIGPASTGGCVVFYLYLAQEE